MEVVATALSKRFRDRTIFSDLDCRIAPDRPLALIGPNGSGKTTLLLILAGLLSPTRGEVQYTERGTAVPPEQFRAARAIVAPYGTLYPQLSAVETLQFFASVDGYALSGKEIDESLRMVGLFERAHDRVGAFSSGMKQRMKYAIACCRPATAIFLDEPTSNLDAAGAAIVEQLVGRWKGRSALIIATNDPKDYAGIEQQIRLA